MTKNDTQVMQITPEQEVKRLEDFKRIAENWDNIPEYAQGKLDGTISAIAAIFLEKKDTEKKAG